MNYFELFEIPASFLPDQSLLKKKFYELSRKYHPDFYTQENETEQAEALQLSSLVNKAYKVLQNPDETIQYILQIKGLMVEDEKYALPPAFLMEMMEINEQWTEANMENDTDQMEKVKMTIANIASEIYQPVQAILEDCKVEECSAEQLLKVKEYYFKKKYLTRILATIA